jgi:hypothetical protein
MSSRQERRGPRPGRRGRWRRWAVLVGLAAAAAPASGCARVALRQRPEPLCPWTAGYEITERRFVAPTVTTPAAAPACPERRVVRLEFCP